MRLAFVTETYPPEINGVALTVRSLVERLRERQHSVDVVRPWQPADGTATVANELRVASHALPRYPGLRFGWPAGRKLRARWQADRPDAVYVATEGPLGFSGLRAARALGIPVLTGFHTRFDEYLTHYGAGAFKPVANAWLRNFHNRAQATLVPTPELQHELRQRGLGNALVLRRSIDSEKFSPIRRSEALRETWGLQPSDLAVLHVGRLAPEKNLELLIAAFRAIHAKRPDARLVIVGEGPALGLLKAAVPEAVYCGLRLNEDLASHYASGDLFLFPSLSETFGNVTLEALASGVPVVAYAQGAARNFLRDGHNGAAVEPGNAEAFVAASVALATKDKLNDAMRVSARASIEELRPQQVAIDFENLVKQFILSADAAPAPMPATPAFAKDGRGSP